MEVSGGGKISGQLRWGSDGFKERGRRTSKD
jgi:hypothetical protein